MPPTKRSLQPTPESLTRIQQCLHRRERSFKLGILGLLFGGAALCAIGPVCIGTGVFFNQFRRGHVGTMTWGGAVGITFIIALPILFIIEHLTRGLFLENVAESQSGMPFIARRGTAGLVFVEMFLWGPRMILAAMRRSRSIGNYRGADRALAASMLGKLLLREDAMASGDVFDASSTDAVASLTYLTFYDWIDISKLGDRVWILSDARKALPAPQ